MAASSSRLRSYRAVSVALAAVFVVLLGACRGDDDGMAQSRRPPTSAPTSTPSKAPPSTGAVAETGAGVWVALESGSVVRVDVSSARVTDRIDAGGPAHNLTSVPGGAAAATVATRGAIVFTTGPPAMLGGRPHDVKPAPGGLVVADGGRPRVVVVGAERSVEAEVEVPGVPHDLAVRPDGTEAWVTLDGRDELVVVDLARRRVVRTVSTGRRPHDLLFSPEGQLWVSDLGGGLYPVGPDDAVGAELALGQEAHHLAFSPDGAELWVTDSPGRAVSVVDPRRGAVLDRVALAGSPHHVVVVGDRVAVADNTRGRLLVLDRASRRIVNEVEVGASPHGVAVAT